jgi:subtilase family serine protease
MENPTFSQAIRVKFVSLSCSIISLCFASCFMTSAVRAASLPVQTEAVGVVSRINDSARPAENATMHLAFALNATSQLAFTNYVNSLTDPSSPNYHKWLTPAQVGEKFGASDDAIRSVVNFLSASGLANIRVSPDRLFVFVAAPRSSVESALGVSINGYSRSQADIARGLTATYFAPDRQPVIDATVATHLRGVFGLSNVAQCLPMERRSQAQPLIGPGGSLDPVDLSKAYNVNALHADGLLGQGETVAIFSPTAYNASDITNFLTANNITTSHLNVVKVDGGNTDTTYQDEACLDIETVVGQAPAATVNVYEAPNNGVLGIFEQLEIDQPNIVSDSWGTPEADVTSSYANSVETVRQALSAEGITVFNSSGDDGSYYSGTNIGVLMDAASPYTTGVGGTELTLSGGLWNSEVAWSYNDGTLGSNLGSGGGLSIYYSEPGWQAGPGVNNSSSNGMRQVPDVAAVASTPFYDVYAGGGQVEYGGTSASAPLWAGAMTLIEQNLGTRLGNINPTLYTIGTNNPSTYHDITSGNNGAYSCTSGWDYVTGWGSADFSKLLTQFGGVPTAITSFTPSSGTIGSSVTITGTTLSSASAITFNGTPATNITSNSSTQIVVQVPTGAATGAISVTTPQGSASSGTNFTVTAGTVVATPSISPNGGAFVSAQSVTLSDTLGTATIYYTTDGSTPTTSSSVYSSAITVASSETIKAIAAYSGDTNSAVASATFTIGQTVPSPTMSPVGGAYVNSQSVTLSDSLGGSTLYYTTNGTSPTTGSSVYSSALNVSSSETVKVLAVKSGYNNSTVASASFIIGQTVPTPSISPNGGTFVNSQSVTITDSLNGTSIYYTTNGTTPTTSSALYSSAVTVSSSETVKAIAVESGYNNSAMASAGFTIGQTVPALTINPNGGIFATALSVSLTDTFGSSSIYYTTDGTVPTASSSLYSAPITVSNSETVKAVAISAGYNNSPVASATFTIGQTISAPNINPSGGTFTSAQFVTISDSQQGTTIYYTTDGSTPSTSAHQYSSAITVSSSETIKAIACETNYVNSPAATAMFTITPPAAAPAINPNGGSFTSSQTVTISDSTTGATIYYTTDASTPTSSSSVYSSPVNVSASETIKAIAAGGGYSSSSVTSASFTINVPVIASFSAGLQMISLPYTLSGVSLDTLFGYSGVKLAVWNQAAFDYSITPTPPANEIVAGQGYWVRFPQAVTVTIAGTPAPTNAPFVISLQAGWNMVGDPFNSSVSLSSLTFNGGTETYAQAPGGSSPLISSSVWSYTAGASGYTSASSLSPDQGYWVYAFTATDMDLPSPGG